MNKLWVRISLTYIGIVIFLIVVPAVVYLTIQADQINLTTPLGEGDIPGQTLGGEPAPLLLRWLDFPRMGLVLGLIRILFSISLVGILVGIIISRGLAAPLHNLAQAAKAVGSQDLSQRIDIKGTDEVREVARAFNAMAAALEEAEELKNNMLADIAHELRTPLTVIQGNLRAILDDVYELDKVEVARLYDQTRQLSRLVDDLHDLTLLEANQFSLNWSDVDLVEVMKDVSTIYEPILEDNQIGMVLELPETKAVVQGDCARITQCLNNLLNNAIVHTPTGGEVRMKLVVCKGWVSLAVQDNGTGIEAKHLPHVFDRFYRVDPDRNRKTGGSGLGLAITKALVLAQGGKIKVDSPGRGQGSEFIIQFPR